MRFRARTIMRSVPWIEEAVVQDAGLYRHRWAAQQLSREGQTREANFVRVQSRSIRDSRMRSRSRAASCRASVALRKSVLIQSSATDKGRMNDGGNGSDGWWWEGENSLLGWD